MIKKTITQKLIEDVTIKKYCDVCLTEIHIGLACGQAKCEYCGKDLCEKCIGHEDDTCGDYRIVYCKSCWDIGENYRPKIVALIDEMDSKVKELYDQWQNECKSISTSNHNQRLP